MASENLVNKDSFARLVAERTETSLKDTKEMVNVVLDVIGECVASGKTVQLTGFGKFVPRDRPARTARNPSTGEPIEVSAKRMVTFKAGAELKDVVSGG